MLPFFKALAGKFIFISFLLCALLFNALVGMQKGKKKDTDNYG